MVDDAELAGLDPYALLDAEAARVDAHCSGLAGPEWDRPSRCAGWTARDLLAHLRATEDYHQACLDGEVTALLTRFAERGVTSLDAANALGIADLTARSSSELLDSWRTANHETRARYRTRGDGRIDTTVGDYPARWQASHVALELATHADDLGAAVTDGERATRTAWMARVSRFALAETKPDANVSGTDGRTHVRLGDDDVDVDVELADDDFVRAAAGRLNDSAGLDEPTRRALNTMP